MPPVTVLVMPFEQACPRCGADFAGDDEDAVADAVVEHARVVHRHALDRDVVLAHLEGVHPHDREK
jgi:predicted small metal-binding protein